MSRGGIFVWKNPVPAGAPRLDELTRSGIAYTYDKERAMLVGTRIEGIVAEITEAT